MLAVLANKENLPCNSSTRSGGNASTYSGPSASRRRTGAVDRRDHDASLAAAKESARVARVKARTYAFKLPAHLGRLAPEARHVKVDNVLAVAPELEGTPLPYIRDHLVRQGRSMLAALSTIQGPASTSSITTLPRTMEFTLQTAHSVAPTHALALIPPTPSTSKDSNNSASQKITIFPTHSLMVLSQCAALPASPFTTACDSSSESSDSESDAPSASSPMTVSLPVIPLTLPSPLTFPLLHGYLYTHSLPGLLLSLLPLSPSHLHLLSTTQSRTALVNHLASHFTPAALAGFASKIHGLWSNACALKVDDEELWAVIEMSWDVVVAALKKAAGASSKENEN